MNRLFALLLLIFSVGTSSASDDFPYFIDGINRINAVLGKSPSPSRTDLIEVSTIGCNIFTQLLHDPKFDEGLVRVSRSSPQARKQLQELARNYDLFLMSFVPVEEKELLKAGLDKEVVADLIQLIKKYQHAVATPVDPGAIKEQFGTLRKEFCARSKDLQGIEDAALADATASQTKRGWYWQLGGAAVVVVDMGASAVAIAGGTVALPGIGTIAGAEFAAIVMGGSTVLGSAIASDAK
ncbi:hypothetical protein [Pseudomonas mandelii]|uniref:hypothetical protein n=1 Tax=Pseudomonas mandelii TaxID=75612 RepID=UPI00224A96A7|nr:hypothetical protein [Pseudomonas mandelii]MCX2900402.1 hypothetical protein [Pseudomonas mandelii]